MHSAFCPPAPTFSSSHPHAPRADPSERFRAHWQPAMEAQSSYFVNDGFYAAQPIDQTSIQQAVCYDPALDPFSWWYYEQQQLASGLMGLSDPSLHFTPSIVAPETLSVNPSLLFAPPTSMETMTGYPDVSRIADHGDLERDVPVLPQPTTDVLSEHNLNIAAAAGYESDGDASMGDEDAEGEDDDEWVPESIASAKRKARTINQPPFQRSPTAVATNVPDDATVIASPFVEQKAALAAMDERPATSHPRGAAAVPANRKRARGGKDSRSEPRRRRISSSSSTAAVATFTCTFVDCSKGYARKAELDRHVLSHTEAPRACGVCGAHLRTNRADVLRRHQLMTSECVKLQRSMSNSELREKGCVTHLEREVAQAKAGEKAKRASRTAKGRAKARA